MKVKLKSVKNSFLYRWKKGNYNKALLGCIFKIYRYWYTDLLIEVKFELISEQIENDSEEFSGTVPNGIIVGQAFCYLGIIVCLEGGIVFNGLVSYIDKCIIKDTGITF
jgi:hypothetical protein